MWRLFQLFFRFAFVPLTSLFVTSTRSSLLRIWFCFYEEIICLFSVVFNMRLELWLPVIYDLHRKLQLVKSFWNRRKMSSVVEHDELCRKKSLKE